MAETTHRRDEGRYYGHLPIHAAEGLHEYALGVCIQEFPTGARILEIGAGSGAFTARLRDAGFEVFATDLDPGQPWIAAMDVEGPGRPPGADIPFDMVVCLETLEHLENPRGALRTMRAMLAPGGKLLASTPNIGHPHSRLKMLVQGAPSIFGPDEYYEIGHIAMLPDWMLAEHARNAGFGDISLEWAGRFDIHGFRRFAFRVEILILAALGVRIRATQGDGVCTVITATAP